MARRNGVVATEPCEECTAQPGQLHRRWCKTAKKERSVKRNDHRSAITELLEEPEVADICGERVLEQ